MSLIEKLNMLYNTPYNAQDNIQDKMDRGGSDINHIYKSTSIVSTSVGGYGGAWPVILVAIISKPSQTAQLQKKTTRRGLLIGDQALNNRWTDKVS